METSWEPPPGLEHLLQDGDLDGNQNGAQAEDDPALQTYEGLLNYDAATGQDNDGQRGLTEMKRSLAKNIFDTLQLHKAQPSAPCLVELEKRSVAAAAVRWLPKGQKKLLER